MGRAGRALALAGGVALLLLALVGGALVAAPRLVDADAAGAAVAAAVRARSGGSLRFERARCSLLPPRILLERPVLGLDGEPSVPPLVLADVAELGIAPGRFLRTGDVARSIGAVSIRGPAVQGHGTVSPAGDLSLALSLERLDVRQAAPWLVLSADGRGTPRVDLEAGTVSGPVTIEVPAAGRMALRAALAFEGTDARWGEASARGAFTLELDAQGSGEGTWSGRFALDLADAEVLREPLRKRAGQPMRATGLVRAATARERGFELTQLRIEPLVLDAFPGGGPQLQIRIGGASAGELPLPPPRQPRRGDP